eukprot:1158107-Amorphochlora_amoeboformis.AAC.1
MHVQRGLGLGFRLREGFAIECRGVLIVWVGVLEIGLGYLSLDTGDGFDSAILPFTSSQYAFMYLAIIHTFT